VLEPDAGPSDVALLADPGVGGSDSVEPLLSELRPPEDSLMPGKPVPPSPRGRGVAAGSIEIAERTGKTRLIDPGPVGCGLSSDVVGGEEEVASIFPVNMLTRACIGPAEIHDGRRCMSGRRGETESAVSRGGCEASEGELLEFPGVSDA